MHVIHACALAVNDYPGGVPVIAKALCKSATTLYHELQPPEGSSAKLGVETAVQIVEITDDDRPLFAWAARRRYACVRLSVPAHDHPATLLQAVARFAKETGEALSAMHRAIDEGRITQHEVHKFEKEVADIAPAAISLVERMRAQAMAQARERAVPGALVTTQKSEQRVAV